MSEIVNIYAKSLLDVSNKKNCNNEVQMILNEISDVYNNNLEFKRLLLDPRIENNIKINIIEEILLLKKFNNVELVINLIKLLLDNSKINLLSEIYYCFKSLNQNSKNYLNITIITPLELDNNQINEIIEVFREIYKIQNIKYEIEINKKLIGGIKVKVGNKIYDGSIYSKLNKIF